jgi:murein DD-endopeptidase MepM/ murein hydrolase activator NlpD
MRLVRRGSSARLLRAAAAAAAGLAAACLGEIRDAIDDATPREQYEASLDAAGLAGSAAVRDWKAAALYARDSALTLQAPFNESGYFAPERAEARGYLIPVRRGQALTARITVRGARAARLFADLYEVPEAGSTAFDHLESADSGMAELEHEIRRDGAVVLVVQPELLSGGRYEVSVTLEPTLGFPVSGHDAGAIRSRFGADRDAGRRRHEGVDIFAPRGTPVVAAAGGLATWVGTNELGGNVVMVRDRARGEGHYYAHLDTQLVAEGTIVTAGDTLGLVGNTGNARTTPPHLHFGIYARGRGAVDPTPYLVPPDSSAGAPTADPELLGEWMRLSTRSDLAPAPGAEGGRVLDAGTVMRAVAATGAWIRVELPDRSTGFVRAPRLVRAAPLGSAAAGVEVLERPDSFGIVVDTTSESARAEVLGRFLAYDFVRLADGTSGWIERRPGSTN